MGKKYLPAGRDDIYASTNGRREIAGEKNRMDEDEQDEMDRPRLSADPLCIPPLQRHLVLDASTHSSSSMLTSAQLCLLKLQSTLNHK